MNEEMLNKDEVMENEGTVAEEMTADEEVAEASEILEEATMEEVKAPVKSGPATAALVLGILALVTTLLLINYILGIIALICGIVYLVKKGTKKGKAIAGIVCASLSLIISTSLWVGIYSYFKNTDLSTMMDDINKVTGGAVDVKGEMERAMKSYLGEEFEITQLEEFIGEEITMETITNFVGDASEEEITAFVNSFNYEALQKELGENFTYKDLENVLGEGFTMEDLKNYMEGLQ